MKSRLTRRLVFVNIAKAYYILTKQEYNKYDHTTNGTPCY